MIISKKFLFNLHIIMLHFVDMFVDIVERDRFGDTCVGYCLEWKTILWQ